MQPEYSASTSRRTTDVTRSVWQFGRLLAPSTKWPVATLETLLGTLLLAGLCYWLKPSDPLLAESGFPWIWLVPLVFALRYGSLTGLLSALVLLVFWLVLIPSTVEQPFPAAFYVGGFLLTVVAGHFSDIWISRIRHLQGISDYTHDRLAALTNNHYLLRISHERLEKELLAQPATLRDAINRLKEQSAAGYPGEALPNMANVLEFLALNCQLETASVYAVHDGELATQPSASIGHGCRLEPADPMLREALEHKVLVHLQELDSKESAYLACIPMKNPHDELKGMLLVQRMPFLALGKDNLQLLMALLNYYVDGLETQPLISQVQKMVPGCPAAMALELARLSQLQLGIGAESSLLVMELPAAGVAGSVFDEVVRQQRTLDMVWAFANGPVRVAVLLLPLTDSNGIVGYLLRLDTLLQQQFNTDLAGAGVAVHTGQVDGNQPGACLAGLLQRCERHV